MKVVAVVAQGLEEAAAQELIELGVHSIHIFNRSVYFESDLSSFYRVHLHARLPFRFLRQIAIFNCSSPRSLYHSIQSSFEWEQWLPPSKSFKVSVTGHCDGLTHSHYTALQVKNALIDFQRNTWGNRSNVNLLDPDICLHLHLKQGQGILSLDSSSNSLHKRGYKTQVGLAPLKENIAAGLMRLTQWDYSVPLVDPLCGSGTLLIESASIAAGLPPGLNKSFLFSNWHDFDKNLWDEEKRVAKSSFSLEKDFPLIIGCENNIDIANQAKKNIKSIGFENLINIYPCDFRDFQLPKNQGLIITNPPYGKRISNEEQLVKLYQDLGIYCKNNASGWQLWILSGNSFLTRFIRMKSQRKFPISNGGIDCRWLKYQIN